MITFDYYKQLREQGERSQKEFDLIAEFEKRFGEMSLEPEFNVEKAIEAQRQYQKETGNPDFAPSSGRCWNCSGQIYIQHISVQQARTGLITGCPICHWSYCE